MVTWSPQVHIGQGGTWATGGRSFSLEGAADTALSGFSLFISELVLAIATISFLKLKKQRSHSSFCLLLTGGES